MLKNRKIDDKSALVKKSFVSLQVLKSPIGGVETFLSDLFNDLTIPTSL